MTTYRPAETVRQLVNAAHETPTVTGQLAREVLTDDADAKAVLVLLATVVSGAIDVARHSGDAEAVLVALATVAAGAIDVAADATSTPFDTTLQRLLGAIPGPAPGIDPDLGLR